MPVYKPQIVVLPIGEICTLIKLPEETIQLAKGGIMATYEEAQGWVDWAQEGQALIEHYIRCDYCRKRLVKGKAKKGVK
jgi:hypothetical protein